MVWRSINTESVPANCSQNNAPALYTSNSFYDCLAHTASQGYRPLSFKQIFYARRLAELVLYDLEKPEEERFRLIACHDGSMDWSVHGMENVHGDRILPNQRYHDLEVGSTCYLNVWDRDDHGLGLLHPSRISMRYAFQSASNDFNETLGFAERFGYLPRRIEQTYYQDNDGHMVLHPSNDRVAIDFAASTEREVSSGRNLESILDILAHIGEGSEYIWRLARALKRDFGQGELGIITEEVRNGPLADRIDKIVGFYVGSLYYNIITGIPAARELPVTERRKVFDDLFPDFDKDEGETVRLRHVITGPTDLAAYEEFCAGIITRVKGPWWAQETQRQARRNEETLRENWGQAIEIANLLPNEESVPLPGRITSMMGEKGVFFCFYTPDYPKPMRLEQG